MGKCMSYQRMVYRNGLLGGYEGAHEPQVWVYGAHKGDFTTNLGAPSTSVKAALIAGDLRRLETDQRDPKHLAAYAAQAGITPEQAQAVLDAFFEGVAGTISDCIHMRDAGAQNAKQPSWQKAGYPRPCIVILPGMYGGEPCLAGTRLPAHIIADTIRDHGREEVRGGWSYLTDAEIDLCAWYGEHYRRRVMRKRDFLKLEETPL